MPRKMVATPIMLFEKLKVYGVGIIRNDDKPARLFLKVFLYGKLIYQAFQHVQWS